MGYFIENKIGEHKLQLTLKSTEVYMDIISFFKKFH